MQDQDRNPKSEKQEQFSGFFGCLPGFEDAGASAGKSAQVQRARRHLATQLAERLTGRALDWIDTDEEWNLVDTTTGELLEDGQGRAECFAALLLKAAHPSNHVTGALDSGEDGLYPAGTALWKPSLRLDPNWAETLRRRSRQVARKAMNHVSNNLPHRERYAMAKKLNWRLSWKLVTLTIEHLPGMNSIDQINWLNSAFKELGKKKIWSNVYGGIKGIEDKLTSKGPHVHTHLLLLSRFLNYDGLRKAWFDSLHSTRPGHIQTPLRLPFIDIRYVTKKKGNESEIETDDAVNEVSKYITKTADLVTPDADGEYVPQSVLLDLCEVRRWPRMFELLGAARAARRAVSAQRGKLDTSCISPGLNRNPELDSTWTEALEPEEKIKYLENGINFWDLKDETKRKKERPPSWRDLMDTLPMKEWLHCIAGRARRAMRFRLQQLSDMNPRAFLMDMTGKVVLCQYPGDESPYMNATI